MSSNRSQEHPRSPRAAVPADRGSDLTQADLAVVIEALTGTHPGYTETGKRGICF